MKYNPANDLLQVTINPGKVYISTNPDQRSYANIEVNIKNVSNDTLTVNIVTILLPESLAPRKTLQSVTAIARPARVWDFAASGTVAGQFDAFPQSGANVRLSVGEAWTFTLGNVTLPDAIVQADAGVLVNVTFSDSSVQANTLNINVSKATARIGHFNADNSNIDPGQQAKLDWACDEMSYCIITPGDSTHFLPSGFLNVTPLSTTVYTLYAYGEGIILSAQWGISVGNPAIVTFGPVNAQRSVDYNSNAQLTWICNNFTKSIALTNDQGLPVPDLLTGGNTPERGTVSIGPITQKTNFTLTAFGASRSNFSEVTSPVTLNDTTAAFSAVYDGELWHKDKVTLNWNITSAVNVSVTPAVTDGPSLQKLVGSVDIFPEDDANYILTVAGVKTNAPCTLQVPVPLTVKKVAARKFWVIPPTIDIDFVPNAAQLQWDVEAQQFSIDNVTQQLQPSGQLTINSPANGTFYTLKAGTRLHPNTIVKPLMILSNCGPYNFTTIVFNEEVAAFAPKIINNQGISTLRPDAIYEVALTGVVPAAGGQMPASITGKFVGFDGDYYFALEDMTQLYQWADPNNHNGSITLLNNKSSGYSSYSFPEFRNVSQEGYSLYNFFIQRPAFEHGSQIAFYYVQISGVTQNGGAAQPYYIGASLQFQIKSTTVYGFMVVLIGSATFAWTDPAVTTGTINLLGICHDVPVPVRETVAGVVKNNDMITAGHMLFAAEKPLLIKIDPGVVYISDNPNLASYANITVTITNNGLRALSINMLTVTLPATLAPTNGLGSVDSETSVPNLWSFDPDLITAGQFDAISVSGGDVDLPAGGRWQFMLNMVTLPGTLDQAAAAVPVTIVFADGSAYQESPVINMELAVPQIISFKADPDDISPGDSTTLKWNCEAIDYCVVRPLSTVHQPASGSVNVSPPSLTIYTLYAYASGVILSAIAPVSVENPSVVTFGGFNNNNTVNYGDTVTLYWNCNESTTSVSMISTTGVNIPSLDQNGNTPQNGSVVLGPITEPVIFTLTAHGDNPRYFGHSEAVVTINNVTVSLTATPDSGLWVKDKVTFNWEVASASGVRFAPQVTNGPSLQNQSGSTDYIPDESVLSLACQLTATGYVNGSIATVNNNPAVTLQFQPVNITEFSIAPTVLIPGVGTNEATLSWATEAQTACIEGGIGIVNTNGSLVLPSPEDGTVYTLLAGTDQNPSLQQQTVTVINAFGPYTFNSFEPNSSFLVAVDFLVTNSQNLNYLVGPNQGAYYINLSGVTVTGGTGTLIAMMKYAINGNGNGFAILFWPIQPNAPVFEWTDPSNQNGTITLTGLVQLSEDLKAIMGAYVGKI
jgi:hypothetical protein